MKAKRKSDGKIIEVDNMPVYDMKSDKEHYKCITDGHHYPADDLDFSLSEPDPHFYRESQAVCNDD